MKLIVSTGASASQSVIVFPEGVQGLLVPLGPNVIARTFRQGDDLVIVYQDGRQVQIAGFFDTGDRVLVAQASESGDLFEVSLAPDGSLIGVEPRSVADIAELLGATQEEVEALSAAHGADADAGFADNDHVTLSTQSGVELAAINPGLIAAGILGAGGLLGKNTILGSISITALPTNSDVFDSKGDERDLEADNGIMSDSDNIDEQTKLNSSSDVSSMGALVASTTPVQGPDSGDGGSLPAVPDGAGGGDTDGDTSLNAQTARQDALEDIEAFAEDQNNPAPTVDTYATAGALGVTDANLAAVNAGIALEEMATINSTNKLNLVIGGIILENFASSQQTILNYALGQTRFVPTVETYIAAGAFGVTIGNLEAANNAVMFAKETLAQAASHSPLALGFAVQKTLDDMMSQVTRGQSEMY
ncbi:hypothetical protein [Ruegeria sp.]|uniref:hypothetical protein n=1 Tax=Ruegeria sp. TaxID=1879320 RepID=UPI003B008B68